MNIRDYIKAGMHIKTRTGHAPWNAFPESYKVVMDAIKQGATTSHQMAEMCALSDRQIQPILWRMKRKDLIRLVHHWELIKSVPPLKENRDWEKVEKLLNRKPMGNGELKKALECEQSHIDNILQHMRRAGCVRVVHYWEVCNEG
jgi:hypothetical protein